MFFMFFGAISSLFKLIIYMFNLKDNKMTSKKTTSTDNTADKNRETNLHKYQFNGEEYGKGPLVLAVIKDYVDHHDVKPAQLVKTFPKELQGSFPVVEEVKNIEPSKERRYFMKADQVFRVGRKKFAVTREWSKRNFQNFVDRAAELGVKIKEDGRLMASA